MNLFSNCKNGNSSWNNSTQRQVKFQAESVSHKSWMKKLSSSSDGDKNDTNDLEWRKIEDYLKRNPHMLTQFVLNNVPRSQLQNWDSQLVMTTGSNNCYDQEHKVAVNSAAKISQYSDPMDTGHTITVSFGHF